MNKVIKKQCVKCHSYFNGAKYATCPYCSNSSETDKGRYCCVLHYRNRPGETLKHDCFAVAFSDAVNGNTFDCKDDGEILNVIVDSEELIANFNYSTVKKIKYEKNVITRCDYSKDGVTEEWEFILSDSPIAFEEVKAGYRKRSDGLYYKSEKQPGKGNLPMGTIVCLNGEKTAWMIFGYNQMDLSNKLVYDYIGAAWPMGKGEDGSQRLFDHEDITEIKYKGYDPDVTRPMW